MARWTWATACVATLVIGACFTDGGGDTLGTTGLATTNDTRLTSTGTSDNATAEETTLDDATTSAGETAATAEELDACADDERCLPEPPDGWSGPVAVRESSIEGVTPGCQGHYPDEAWALFGGLDPGAASCSCSCGPVDQGACAQELELVRFLDPVCDLPSIDYPIGACTTLNWTPARLRYTAPEGEEPTCAPAETPAIAEPSFTTQWKACVGSPGAACDAGRCVGDAPDGFDDALCIYQEGEHGCPPGPFTQQQVRHLNLDDQRGCPSACQCGPPSEGCQYTMQLYSTMNCAGESTTLPPDQCLYNDLTTGSAALLSTVPPASSCAPVAPEVDVIGDVTPTGAVTFCCE